MLADDNFEYYVLFFKRDGGNFHDDDDYDVDEDQVDDDGDDDDEYDPEPMRGSRYGSCSIKPPHCTPD